MVPRFRGVPGRLQKLTFLEEGRKVQGSCGRAGGGQGGEKEREGGEEESEDGSEEEGSEDETEVERGGEREAGVAREQGELARRSLRVLTRVWEKTGRAQEGRGAETECTTSVWRRGRKRGRRRHRRGRGREEERGGEGEGEGREGSRGAEQAQGGRVGRKRMRGRTSRALWRTGRVRWTRQWGKGQAMGAAVTTPAPPSPPLGASLSLLP